MLNEVADGVWVRQSEWVWSNSIVVRGEEGLVVVDPGINGAELDALADDLERLGVPVVAGFSTHPHWDHLLWHPRFGDVPRYGSAANVQIATGARERGQQMAAESAEGIPLELLGLLTPLPDGNGPMPGEIILHDGHAAGHAAILLADRGVLIVGDMLSDALVPIPSFQDPDRVATYAASLDLLEKATGEVDVLIPGHGGVARGDEIAARFATDRAWIEAVARGEHPEDERFGPKG